MLESNGSITADELKAYLESLEEERTKEEALRISQYTKKCEEEHKNVNEKNIRKIKEKLKNEYERRKQTKDKILSILKECDEIPRKIEKLEVVKYMICRADVKGAEKIIQREIEELEDLYDKNAEEILEEMQEIPELENVEEIVFNTYKHPDGELAKTKEEFKEELSEDEKKNLFKEKLDKIENIKKFNTVQIPNRVLKNADKDMQLKLPKFMLARQKKIKTIDTMKEDYMKLVEPKECKIMIDDALGKVETISNIIEENEYKKVKRKLIKTRKRIEKSTSEIRYIIGTKEKKIGVDDYNTQSARQNRIEKLETEIDNANKKISSKNIEDLKKQLAEIEKAYAKEKQFKTIVSKFKETENDKNSEELIKEIRKNRLSLKRKIERAEKTIEEEEKKIIDTNKELLALWKIEIDSTLEIKHNALSLSSNNEQHNEKENDQNIFEKAMSKLKKMYEDINDTYIKDE